MQTSSYLQAFHVSMVDDNLDFFQKGRWLGLMELVHCTQHGLCHYIMWVAQVSSPQGWESDSCIAKLIG